MHDADRLPVTGSGRSRTGELFGGLGILALLVLGLAVFFIPTKTLLLQGQSIKTQLDGVGHLAPLVFTLAAALLTALGAPRLLVSSLAGMAFGAVWGLAWSLLGTLLGAYATFLAVRGLGRGPILRRYPKLDRFAGRIEGKGIMAVLLIRQLPMNGFYNNLLLGLSPVRHRDFLIGSLLGFLPLGATAVLIGAGVVQGEATRIIQYSAAGIAAFVILGFLLRQFMKAARSSKGELGTPRTSPNDGLD